MKIRVEKSPSIDSMTWEAELSAEAVKEFEDFLGKFISKYRNGVMTIHEKAWEHYEG